MEKVKYEFHVLEIPNLSSLQEVVIKELNAMGEQGWELAGIASYDNNFFRVTRYFFQRVLQE